MGFLNGLLGGNNSFQAQGVNTGLMNDALNGQGATSVQQQAFVNALQGQNGIGNQSQVFNQLQNVANGQGPNPAQAMLANQTGQNVAQQAALMGSQRGVGSNPGLLAREAAQQGSQIQQNAVGQGAALQAQQSLGALGQLGNLATQQVNQQGNALNSLAQQQGNISGQLLNYNQGQNQLNAGVAHQNAQNAQPLIGGALSGAGLALGLSEGGAVPQPGQASSFLGRALMDCSGGMTPYSSGGHVPGHAQVSGDSETNDTVPAMLSPGEIVVPRTDAMSPEKAAAFAYRVAMRKGK